ncbi:MAG: aspartyl protease family protein, partial [Chitinophagales bacterium]
HGVAMRIDKVTSIPLTLTSFETDPFLISSFLGVNIHGILGFEFFKSFIVEIDFEKKRISLTKPEYFHIKNGFTAMPVEFQYNKPYIQSTLYLADTALDLDFLLDTGAGFPIMVEAASQSAIALPSNVKMVQLGIGLNGPVYGNIGRIPAFSIGHHKMENVVAGFPEMPDSYSKHINEVRYGSIGNYVLNRFQIVLDYNGSHLYLKPNINMQKHFPFDRVGAEVIASGDKYSRIVVQWVKPDSPADCAGILAGDEIMEINRRKAAAYKLEAIDALFSNPAIKSIALKIRRNESYFYLEIVPKDMI